MKIHDSLIGLAIFVGGLIIFFHSKTFPDQFDGSPGPALFPMVLSGLFSLCGLVLFVKNIKTFSLNSLILKDGSIYKRGLVNIVILIAVVLFYASMAETLGFLICMGVVLFALMLMLKSKLLPSFIVAFLADIGIYLIFAKGLLVPLPYGLLGF